MGRRVARMPLAKSEVKTNVFSRFHQDGTEAARMLDMRGSEACRVCRKLGLNRMTIRSVMSELSEDRRKQVTINSIICATRLKYFGAADPGSLRPTQCQMCNNRKIDTFGHLTECTGLRNIPQNKEFLIDYLVALAGGALKSNPGLPKEFLEDPGLNLIDYSDASLGEISLG